MSSYFSVIVPIYKVEKYVRKCIQSILDQSFFDYELILVDDGSPDCCPQICDEYAKKDKRVVVIHKKNGGLVSARNAGLEIARGKYICYVDGDDWIDSKLLEIVYKATKKYLPDMVIFNAVRVFQDRTESLPRGLDEGIYDKKELEKRVYPRMLYDPEQSFCHEFIFPVSWNKIYKRELLQKHYCKDERICMGEDSAFVYECLYYSEKIYFCEDVLYYYNQLNEESFIHRYDNNRFRNNKYLTEYVENNLGGKNSVLDFQINAFKAHWLIMAVFHEVKTKQPLLQSVKHIRTEINKTKVLETVNVKGLPFVAKVFLTLLKMHFFLVALLGAKIVTKKRG